MNSHTLARSAYGLADGALRTTRGTEYDVFARITARLCAARDAMSFTALAQAIHENRRLWSILASDVADDGNRLPQPLRARIFYLAEFTRSHSRKVLAREADASILIDINTAMMRGLRDAGGGAA